MRVRCIWVRVKYGSGVFRFCGFRVNSTGRDRHFFYCSREQMKLAINAWISLIDN